jgi:hypothetical protein
MESLKEQDERAVGDRFVGWFNAQYDLNYSFIRRAGEAPDLVYALPDKTELFIEITSAYYGDEYAKFIWNGVRSSEDQVLVSEGSDLDAKLASDIVRIVGQKCGKRYEKHCVLVVGVTAFWTSAKTLRQLMSRCEFPDNNFAGIYVHGRFSSLSLSLGENEYSMIPIKTYDLSKTNRK